MSDTAAAANGHVAPAPADVIRVLGASAGVAQLQARIERWLAGVDPELTEPLRWAFDGPSKYFGR